MSVFSTVSAPLSVEVEVLDTPAGCSLGDDVRACVDDYMHGLSMREYRGLDPIRSLLILVKFRYFSVSNSHWVVCVNRDGEQPAASCTYLVGDVYAAFVAAKVLAYAHPLSAVEVGMVSEGLRFYVGVGDVIRAQGV